MEVNQLIFLVKKKIEKNILAQNVIIKDKTYLHKKHLTHQEDKFHLDTIHIGAWGSIKYKLFAVTRNWPPYRKLKKGLRSNSDFLFPRGIFLDGRKLEKKHLVDTWGLFQKPTV